MHCIATYGYWVKTLAPKRYPKKETCSSADRKATTPWELTAAFGQLHLRTAIFSLRVRGENPWTQMFWWEIHGAFNIFNGNEWGVNQDLIGFHWGSTIDNRDSNRSTLRWSNMASWKILELNGILQFYIQYIAGKINEQNLFKLWTFQQATFDCQSATIQLLISKQLGYTGIRSYSHAGVDRMWTYIYIIYTCYHMLNTKMLKCKYVWKFHTLSKSGLLVEDSNSWRWDIHDISSHKLDRWSSEVRVNRHHPTGSLWGFFQRPILIQLICQTPP